MDLFDSGINVTAAKERFMNKNKKRFEHKSKDYTGLREYPVTKNCELLEFLLETLKGQSLISTE